MPYPLLCAGEHGRDLIAREDGAVCQHVWHRDIKVCSAHGVVARRSRSGGHDGVPCRRLLQCWWIVCATASWVLTTACRACMQKAGAEPRTCGCQSLTSMPRHSKPTMPTNLPSSSAVYDALRMSFALVLASFCISCTFRCAGILLSLCHRRAKLAEPLLPGSSSS